MNFFEQELRKIVDAAYPDAAYVGRAAYVGLADGNKAKIEFGSTQTVGDYDKLGISIINAVHGVVDRVDLLFKDVLGKKLPNTSPAAAAVLKDGLHPYVREAATVEWYAYQPTDEDYATLTNALATYLGVFDESDDPNCRCVAVIDGDGRDRIHLLIVDNYDENFTRTLDAANRKCAESEDEWPDVVPTELRNAGYEFEIIPCDATTVD